MADARADRADDNFNTFVNSMENTVHLLIAQMQNSSRQAAEQAATDRVEAARQPAETCREDRAIMQPTLMSHRQPDALELEHRLEPMIRTIVDENQVVREPARLTGDQAAILTSLAEIRVRAADNERTSAAAIADLTASVRLLQAGAPPGVPNQAGAASLGQDQQALPDPADFVVQYPGIQPGLPQAAILTSLAEIGARAGNDGRTSAPPPPAVVAALPSSLRTNAPSRFKDPGDPPKTFLGGGPATDPPE